MFFHVTRLQAEHMCITHQQIDKAMFYMLALKEVPQIPKAVMAAVRAQIWEHTGYPKLPVEQYVISVSQVLTYGRSRAYIKRKKYDCCNSVKAWFYSY